MATDNPPQLGPRRPWTRKDCVAITLIVAGVLVPFAIASTGSCFLVLYLDRKFPSTVFTVAITGVTGLDDDPAVLLRSVIDDTLTTSSSLASDGNRIPAPLAAPPPTATTTLIISPVFNLTFQVDNTRNSQFVACVAGLSRADVSYGDAFLAGGSVPLLCVGEFRRSDGVAAMARGENVAVPRFVMDQLAAGDATVDVKVTMPTYCRFGRCRAAVLSCKPKIGGGTSPACRVDPQRSTFCVLFNELCDY